MKKRWGVRVIAILMLIAGLSIFLLGILPAILAAVRGTAAGLGVWLAIPSALVGCAGAFLLMAVSSVLLTLGRIADNFAAVRQHAPEPSTAPAVAVAAAAPQSVTEGRGSRAAAVVATTAVALPEAEVVPAPVAAAVIVGAVVLEEHLEAGAEIAPAGVLIEEAAAPGPTEHLPLEEAAEIAAVDTIIEEAAAPGPEEETVLEEAAKIALAGAAIKEVAAPGPAEGTPPEEAAEIVPAEVVIEEAAAPGPVEESAPEKEATPAAETVAKVSAAEVAAEVLEPQAVGIRSRQEEVSALQAQLAALQTQLDELGEIPEIEDLPAAVEDEGPAPGAAEELKLPGSDEAAQIAAEMAALGTDGETEAS